MQAELLPKLFNVTEVSRVALNLLREECLFTDRINDHRFHLILLFRQILHRYLWQAEDGSEVCQLLVRKLGYVLGFDVLDADLVLLLTEHFKSDSLLHFQRLALLHAFFVRTHPLICLLLVVKLELACDQFIDSSFFQLLEVFDLLVGILLDLLLQLDEFAKEQPLLLKILDLAIV